MANAPVTVADLASQFDLSDCEGRSDFRLALYMRVESTKVDAIVEEARKRGQEPRDRTRWGAVKALARTYFKG